MEEKGSGKEALVIGYGMLFGDLPVALAISNFAYMGGSMGAVVGEKFFAISKFACRYNLPLIAVTATGGARMQEGTVALAQMGKTTAAVVELRRKGLPYISILGHPTIGGVLASYATLADFILAEQKATLSFAGDRVVKLTSGGRGVNSDAMTSEFFAQHGGVHAVVKRHELRTILAGILRMTPWFKDRKESDLMLARECQICCHDRDGRVPVGWREDVIITPVG
jgi:acetyl-CoA carboxylase carboxyl transferase subunit beta